jgi:hypothetical protein
MDRTVCIIRRTNPDINSVAMDPQTGYTFERFRVELPHGGLPSRLRAQRLLSRKKRPMPALFDLVGKATER